MNQITITLTGNDPAAHANTLRNYANMFDRATGTEKTTTQKRVAKAFEQEETESEENEELDTTEDDTSLDLAADDTEQEEAPKAKAATKGTTKITLDGNIIPAFQAYAKKHTREKAAKVLAKYKVKNVRELPTEKFSEILKLLGA